MTAKEALPLASLGDYKPLPRRQYSRRFMDTHRVILLKEDASEAVVGVSSLDCLEGIEAGLAERHKGQRLTYVLVDPGQLMEYLTREFSSQDRDPGDGARDEGSTRIDVLSDDAPIVNLVNSVFLEAIRLGSSDIHLEAADSGMTIRYRVDGQLRSVLSIKKERADAVSARIKLMANLNILERRLPQDGRLEVNIASERLDVRVSVVPSISGESTVLRLFNSERAVLGVDDLGFSAAAARSIREAIRAKDGLILATGPTGSGKTTTLNALLREIDASVLKIVTIEDPVETRLPGAVQIQVNEEIGLTFGEALKRVFRHDPDVIMVGEIRDPESAELAIRAALTGHLVFSSLHTNDTVSSVARLRNLGVESYLIASVFRTAVAQRLVRRVCPTCSEPGPVTAVERELFDRHGVPVPDSLPRAKGCPACGNTGFSGRLAVSEVLCSDEGLEGLISRAASAAEILEATSGRGFVPMRGDAVRKVAAGLTTLAEAEREIGIL